MSMEYQTSCLLLHIWSSSNHHETGRKVAIRHSHGCCLDVGVYIAVYQYAGSQAATTAVATQLPWQLLSRAVLLPGLLPKLSRSTFATVGQATDSTMKPGPICATLGECLGDWCHSTGPYQDALTVYYCGRAVDHKLWDHTFEQLVWGSESHFQVQGYKPDASSSSMTALNVMSLIQVPLIVASDSYKNICHIASAPSQFDCAYTTCTMSEKVLDAEACLLRGVLREGMRTEASRAVSAECCKPNFNRQN